MTDTPTKPQPESPPFNIEIPEFGYPLTFNTYEDLANWAEGERKAWSKIELRDVVRLSGNEALDFHKSFFERLVSDAKQAARGDKRSISRVEAGVKTLRNGQTLPLSGTRGQKFQQLLTEDNVTALGMLIWDWTKNSNVRNSNEPSQTQAVLTRAIVDARVRDIAGEGHYEAVNKSLEKLSKDWELRGADHLKLLRESKKQVDDLFVDANANYDTVKRDLETMRHTHHEEMEKIRKSYETLMQVKGPARYWRVKKWVHLIVSALAFSAFAFSIYTVFDLAWNHRDEFMAILPRATDGNIGLGAVAFITLPMLAFFWFLRLISRIYVTNIQGMSDAGNRATMITTFLAMLKDKENPIAPEERLLILRALFRSPGETSDDTTPESLYEGLISRATKGN